MEGSSYPVARLTMWGCVEIDGRLHLVGVLLGGHTTLPAGHWIITSSVAFLDPDKGFAVTASTLRPYRLHDSFGGPWPEEVMDLIVDAMARWGASGLPPRDAIPEDVLRAEIISRGLNGCEEGAGAEPGTSAPGGGAGNDQS